MEYKNISELREKIITIAEDDTAIAKNLVQVKGYKDFLARAHREKALFTILLLKELKLISPRRFQAMTESLDKDFKEQKRKAQEEMVKEEIKEELEIEMLEYGDTVELENGDICVYIRKELDTSRGLITQELNLVNIFTGEENNINEYRNDLTHNTDPNLSIKRFAN